MIILAVILLGLASGLRIFTAVAVVAWALHVDHLDRDGTPFTFMGSHLAVLVLSLAALGEHVFDLLPFAPPRTSLPSLIGRIVMGTFASAVLLAAIGQSLAFCVVGSIAAAVGAFAGYRARIGLVRKLDVRDFMIAIPEDFVAIGLSVAAVCLVR